MRLVTMIVTVSACMAAAPAWSCSRVNWNTYEDFGQPPGRDVLARSATVDWIRVEPPPPARCPRYPDGFTHPEVYDDDSAWERGPEECQNFSDEGVSPIYIGSVIERLKGRSPDRFALMRYIAPRRDETDRDSEWSAGRWERFTDLRRTPATRNISFSLGERSTAEGRHRDLAFWDGGDIGFNLDGSNSCGGVPTLDPDMRYVVFRDENGAVLALEPVLHDDDAFLGRLRDHADAPAAFAATPYPVRDFFRSALGLLEARILSCDGGGSRSSYETERATLRVTRGDPGPPQRTFWSLTPETGEGRFAFNDLWDFYQTRNEPCPRGESILLLVAGLPGTPTWDGALAWTEDRFPGWHDAASSRLRELDDEDRITPLEFFLTDPLPKAGQPRPIRIHDGRIRLADIPTGLTLAGPDWITVEQAFQWFEEGRAAATPVPSSS
ncbi:hypothetical protein [Brevundimonas sp.]|uniref:hypothetical protein n=1 Tax=Brevundimonas sp. TaxID=1871086 RepID=UPI002D51F9FE|nr:hypothetical protein [Brevundimonas sp.]HYC96783.1 hypothetical protein [Brevundimonas sp.]